LTASSATESSAGAGATPEVELCLMMMRVMEAPVRYG
jgi:hypothetical protein